MKYNNMNGKGIEITYVDGMTEHFDPISDGAQIIAQMKVASWLNAGNDAHVDLSIWADGWTRWPTVLANESDRCPLGYDFARGGSSALSRSLI